MVYERFPRNYSVGVISSLLVVLALADHPP